MGKAFKWDSNNLQMLCGHMVLVSWLKTGIAESFGNFILNFLRNCQTALQSGNSNLHPHLPRPRVHVLTSLPHPLWSVLVAGPPWCRTRCLTVILICGPWWLTITTFSSWNCVWTTLEELSRFFTRFSLRYLSSLQWTVRSLYIF